MPSEIRDPVKSEARGAGAPRQASRRERKTRATRATKAGDSSAATNLPARLSSFVAREQEMQELLAKLGSGRLVTLTGPAGVGKTSLALQAAGLSAGSFEDGVWVAELAGILRDGLVVQTVASALKVIQQDGSSLTDLVVSHLAPRRALLVLDNCEHVLGECATLADLLLKSCPELSLLATSQEPLGLAGESVYQLPPLSLPAAGERTPAKLMKSDSVLLFAERAVSLHPAFRLDEQTGPAVAEICRKLDGIPLAIELAAARVSLLSPAEILERLDDRFRLLTGGDRAALPRHRTLRTALEWSYGLLTEKEQQFLGRLSVFSGGFTLAAAGQVCTGGPISALEVFELVESLKAKSLIMSEPGREKTRYHLLETVREFARQKLSPEEAHRVSMRCAEWALEMAENAEAARDTPEEHSWMELLDEEYSNVRAALEWYSSSGNDESGLRLAAALSWFWLLRGHLTEGRQWLEAALARAEQMPQQVRASALAAAGSFATLMGDSGEAMPMFEESVSIYEGLDDPEANIALLKMIAMNQLFLHDPPTALPALQKAVESARKTGNPSILVAQLVPYARALLFHGQILGGQEVFEEARAVAEWAGDARRKGDALAGLGWALMLRGHCREAEKRVQQGLQIAGEIGDVYGTALALSLAGDLAALQGELKRAKALLRVALETARSMRTPFPEARSLAALGRVALDEGQPAKAVKFFRQVISVSPASAPKYLVPTCLVGLAEAAQAAGDWKQAVALGEEALARADENKDSWSKALALYCQGVTDELSGKVETAGRKYHQALELRMKIGDQAGAVDCLEGMANLAVPAGRHELAVRLLAFCERFRGELGYRRRGPRVSSYDDALVVLRRTLSKRKFHQVWEQGAGLSLPEAAARASRGRGPRGRRGGRPAVGWASLTPAELEVVSQVCAGMTNREIAEHLFISPRTVEAHLSQVFSKLGLKSRREVVKQANLREEYSPQTRDQG